jgi:hypothetical protein
MAMILDYKDGPRHRQPAVADTAHLSADAPGRVGDTRCRCPRRGSSSRAG